MRGHRSKRFADATRGEADSGFRKGGKGYPLSVAQWVSDTCNIHRAADGQRWLGDDSDVDVHYKIVWNTSQ